ncbi:MAG: hypothetical protein ACPGXL_09215 [Chitinophagales bacterium]
MNFSSTSFFHKSTVIGFLFFFCFCFLGQACTTSSSTAVTDSATDDAPKTKTSMESKTTPIDKVNSVTTSETTIRTKASGDFEQLMERLLTNIDFAPVPSSQWNYGYRPPKRSDKSLLFVDETHTLHEGLSAYKNMEDTKLTVSNISSVVLKRKTTASTKPDVKITEFTFQNTPPNEADKASLKAISDYIFSSRSTIKHPNWAVYVNEKGYLFETRAVAFEQQTKKIMQAFEALK